MEIEHIDITETVGDNAIQKADGNSVQIGGEDSIQKAWENSVLIADSNSTQTAGSNSTCISEFLTKVIADGENIVARRVDITQCIILNNQTIQWCPRDIDGYIELIDGKWYLNGDTSFGEHIIADGILSKIVK